MPPEQQQIVMIEQAEDEKSSAFSIPQATIDAVLQQGSGVEDGKYRIYLQFQQNASNKENAAFLKDEYGIGGRYPTIAGTKIDECHDGNGITLTTGNAKTVLSWSKVQKRIGELIAADLYLNSKEKGHLPIYQQQMEEQRPVEQDKPELPSRENSNYDVGSRSTVYIGADEYEVRSIDTDTVELRDVRFPLFSKAFFRKDFDRLLSAPMIKCKKAPVKKCRFMARRDSI